jgi:hypothetical protein
VTFGVPDAKDQRTKLQCFWRLVRRSTTSGRRILPRVEPRASLLEGVLLWTISDVVTVSCWNEAKGRRTFGSAARRRAPAISQS